MAGAGFRVFGVAEVLASAVVNTYLMQQAVMVFDDATDRSTDLPSPSEGMYSDLRDQDSLFRYDGSGWVRLNTDPVETDQQILAVSIFA